MHWQLSTERRRTSRLLLAGATVVACLALAGCGNDGNDANLVGARPSSESTPSSATTTAVKPKPAAAAPDHVANAGGVDFTAQDDAGDAIKGDITVGDLDQLSGQIDDPGLAACRSQVSQPDRAMAAFLIIDFELTSSLQARVTMDVSHVKTVTDGTTELANDFTTLIGGSYDGSPSCGVATGTGQAGAISWDAEAGSRHTWKGWLVFPDVITPKDALGLKLIKTAIVQPLVGFGNGGQPISPELSGKNLVFCKDGDLGEPQSFLAVYRPKALAAGCTAVQPSS